MQTVAATEVLDDYLESTDHIAYQYSNLIQPHVLFLNLDRHSRAILNVSSNAGQWIGLAAAELCGRQLNDELIPGISLTLDKIQPSTGSIQVFAEGGRDRWGQPLLCRVYSTTTHLMLELELKHQAYDVDIDTRQLEALVLSGVQSLSSRSTIDKLVTDTTCALREALGFERGMCYQFDDEGNGEVIAEATAVPGDEKYLWLRFPARDVPRTARQMLLTSPIRATFDQTLECQQIYPALDPLTEQYVDLTSIRGRGAAGSCRQFYLNMGIRSTLVLPLIVEHRLWGMLAFHDVVPKRVSPLLDGQLQAIATCLSTAIERNLHDSRERIRQRSLELVAALTEVAPTSSRWLRHVQTRTCDLKELIPCSGFILRLSGEVLVCGAVPNESDRQELLDCLDRLSLSSPLATNHLAKLCPDYDRYEHVAAGLIAIPLTSSHNDLAIWLRSEQKQTVRWAGDPLGKIELDELGRKQLGLRESFETWSRITEKSCVPWTESELSLAASAAMQLGLLTLSWYAAQANQAKTQFLSCMSHEIRTPMTAILGYANLLKEQPRCTSQCESQLTGDYVDIIQRNGQHLLSIIDDILNLAKIEAGKLTIERIPISIIELVADVAALIKVQAETKQLDFHVSFDTSVPKEINSDPVRLRQILLNLLGNAFKFTDRGRVQLRVGYWPEKKQLYFEVIDTGIGLTQAQIGRLFNPFTQADSSTTRRFGGSGLGLQISQQLAHLLSGHIEVQSELGVGSTFRVTMATDCAAAVELIDPSDIGEVRWSAKAAENPSPATALSLQSLRIMLIEDGEDNQRLLKYLLNKAGARVTVFANGKLAIEAVTVDGRLDGELQSPFPYDIVLTDMQMPELDGYSTARLLRQKGCHRPIIALTAFAMEGNDHECLQAGCDDYLSKPVQREALIAICAKWRCSDAFHSGKGNSVAFHSVKVRD